VGGQEIPRSILNCLVKPLIHPKVNYLDRANLNNAYVSGAREDLNFKGTQLNQINTIFYGGYLLGQVRY
jgi:hypothetical protein